MKPKKTSDSGKSKLLPGKKQISAKAHASKPILKGPKTSKPPGKAKPATKRRRRAKYKKQEFHAVATSGFVEGFKQAFGKKELTARDHAFEAAADWMRHESLIFEESGATTFSRERVEGLFHKFGRYLKQVLPEIDWCSLIFEQDAGPEFEDRTTFLSIPSPVSIAQPMPVLGTALLYKKLKEKRIPIHEQARNVPPPISLPYAVLGYPLLVGKRLIGALVLGSTNPRHKFGEKDKLLLQPFAVLWLNFWLEKQWRASLKSPLKPAQ